MNIRRYLLSNVFRSPDDPVAPPTHPDDVVVTGNEPPAGDPPAPIAPVAGDPPAPQEPPAAPEPPAPAGQPWYMRRLAEESAKVAREREQREAAERRATDAEALAQRLQQAPPDPNNPPAPRAPAPAQPTQRTDDEFQAAVRRQAQLDRLQEDSVEVLRNGSTAFKDFQQTRDILTAIGATRDDFIADLLAVDKANAHVLLDKLAKDPELAVSLTQMDGRRRIAELTRMSTAIAPKTNAPAPAAPAAPAPPVSRAPRPAPVLSPAASEENDAPLSDDVSDEEWSKNWDRLHKKRA